MAKLIDLTGQKFGKLTVLGLGEKHIRPSGQKVNTWICQCECGTIKEIEGAELRKGKIKSCGCLKTEMIEDLSGKKYGRLTVLSLAQKNPVKWNCKCDCGNKIIVSGKSLKNGGTKSCGCLRNQRVHETVSKDELGKKYGRLTVLAEDDERSSQGTIKWICECDCGNIVSIPGNSLRSGNTKSCGCLAKDLTKVRYEESRKKVIGNVYNFLKVTEDAGTKNYKSYVYCTCLNCGKEHIEVSLGDLIQNKRISCGCLNYSAGELKIKQLLEENNIKYEKEKTFNSCRFPDTNYLARFDFYLPDYNILIEYDGEQHFSYRENGWNTKENFEKIKERDNYKNKWCIENKIKLIRISYQNYLTLTLKDLLGE